MTFFQSIFRVLLVCIVCGSANAQPINVLFLGDEGHHQPRKRFDELQPVLSTRGVQLTYTGKVTDLNPATLAQYDALMLYANIDNISKSQSTALLDYVAKGNGFIPLHCATFCFRNDPEIVALMGAQFQRHGTGTFRTSIDKPGHPLMKGYGGFESWDETYVHHLHNEKNRTVLEYRVDSEGREPWTWVRTHGNGRVFYTAWGHDHRTWNNPGFHNLVERGVRWATRNDPQSAGTYLNDVPFPVPESTKIADSLEPFEYEDVGKKIPNYTKSKQWGKQDEPLNLMQKPVAAERSMQHIVVPEGFHVELFASEPDLGGKPICMAWDERGRLWVAETMDYPNELKPPTKGRDRIRICEDTDGDGRADKFTVFAENLSIPTSIAFYKGGVIVQNGVETLYLKDTTGDDQCDFDKTLFKGWQLGDTHGGVSNFQYGLDNWIWAMQGYNNSRPVVEGEEQQAFRMGFFRFKPDGSELEFIRSTNNNTWGLGISEEGLIFGSTANGNPSIYMPIPNRYYERVRGWATRLTLSSIAESNAFNPVTEKVRQVDWHGGYTAGAGHALYTAREYPQEYWNRVAFVNGPTGHLVGAFVLNESGTDFSSKNSFNLFASHDEWTAPIMSEVGPDGQMWVLDWYNYIVQHNPTPRGFESGKGNAYETDLRDKRHGRIYRVVADGSKGANVPDLSQASPQELVATLSHPTMIVRKHAQRLLVERGESDVASELIGLVKNEKVDEIGLNVGAIHALWTMQGLGLLDGSNEECQAAVYAALSHPSAGVRRNALQVLPPSEKSVTELAKAGLHQDRNAHVRLASLLALADLPSAEAGAAAILSVLQSPGDLADRWIPDALSSAAAQNNQRFLKSLANVETSHPKALEIVTRIANHYARGDNTEQAAEILTGLAGSDHGIIQAVAQGIKDGWRSENQVNMDDSIEDGFERLMKKLPMASRGMLVTLATEWGSTRMEKYGEEVVEAYLEQVANADATDVARIVAATQVVEFRKDDAKVATALLDEITPQVSPELAQGILRSVGYSRSEAVGPAILARLAGMTPLLKKAALSLLLKRPSSTRALLNSAKDGKVALTDLALDQQQALAAHPDKEIRDEAAKLLKEGGSLPNADRQKVVEQYLVAAKGTGDGAKGKAVFAKHCSKCHLHNGEGNGVGPDLTGISVHPKEELLVHILDPSRSVEGNFRLYNLITADGLTLSGMLASESRTSIELFDAEGKSKNVLREDIDELTMSGKSLMPEGFENSIDIAAMTDLLEFLATRQRFIPIPLEKYATAISTKGLFTSSDDGPDRMVFDNWEPKKHGEIPFHLTDPQGKTKPNIILLHGPQGTLPPKMPKNVRLDCNIPAKAIHLLSGVGGWNHPYAKLRIVSMVVRVHYENGESEDFEMINGVHFADYIRRVDVPKSEFAFALGGQQVRHIKVPISREDKIVGIEFMKGDDESSPIIMAVTMEMPDVAGH